MVTQSPALLILATVIIIFSSCEKGHDHAAMLHAEHSDTATHQEDVVPDMATTLPVTTPVQMAMPLLVNADGLIDYDTRDERNIASRFSGRIEKLYVKTMFQPVRKGEVLMEIYSPEMVAEQQRLISLLQDRGADSGLIHASEKKLLLLGMNDNEIALVRQNKEPLYRLPVYSPYDGHVHETGAAGMSTTTDEMGNQLLLKEGMYVERGATVINLLNTHRVWAVLNIAEEDAARLTVHDSVLIHVEGNSHLIRGVIDLIEPLFRSSSKSMTVRVDLMNANHLLKVGMFVQAAITADSVSGLWVPRTAVRDLGLHKVVWLKSGNTFKPHAILTGLTTNGWMQVTGGITAQDSIASDVQYLTDSESFIVADNPIP